MQYGVVGSTDGHISVQITIGESFGGMYTISELCAATMYTIVVAAVNSAGSGEYSDSV